eukprot:2970832-Alexandrium_andersonii.AAC.1
MRGRLAALRTAPPALLFAGGGLRAPANIEKAIAGSLGQPGSRRRSTRCARFAHRAPDRARRGQDQGAT